MEEPPAKRPRREDVIRNMEKDKEGGSISSPRSPRAYEDRQRDSRINGHDSRRRGGDEDWKRRRSRSGSRSRSRSPVRDRHGGSRRERSRDRSYRDRDRDRDRERDRDRNRGAPRQNNGGGGGGRDRDDRDTKTRKRSKSPVGNYDREHSKSTNVKAPSSSAAATTKKEDTQNAGAMDLVPVQGGGEDDEEAAMKRVMGFGGFRSTKNTKVPGNQIYGVRKEKKTTYRQYMNRVGGFNRPLSPSRA